MNITRNRGFTVIELIITLIIASVLVIVAIPGLNQMLAGNRLTALTNRLVSSIHLARSEAVTRNGPVIICSNNATATNWSEGWYVNAGDQCGSGDLLREVKSDGSEMEVKGVQDIIFRGDGTAWVTGVDGQTASFKLVNASFSRQVVVNKSGHVSTQSVDAVTESAPQAESNAVDE